MRITLNLATRPFTDLGPALKRLRIAMAVLAVLCIIFLFGLHLFDRQAEAVRAREHSLDGQIARVQGERAAAEAMMQQPENARLVTQADFLNQRFDEKAFSWTLAMEAMETVLPGGVQVTSIEPLRDKDGHITVHVRVVGPRNRADDLVSNLERSRRFLEPRIVGENAESTNGPSRNLEPVSASNRFDFDLLADYNPPSPEERASLKRAAKASAKAKPSPSVPRGSASPVHGTGGPTVPPQPGRQPYTEPSPSKPPASGPSSFFRNPTHGGPQ